MLPTAANNTVSTPEATVYPLKLADIGFSDTDGNALKNVLVVTLPSSSIGVLFDGGTAVTATGIIPGAESPMAWSPSARPSARSRPAARPASCSRSRTTAAPPTVALIRRSTRTP